MPLKIEAPTAGTPNHPHTATITAARMVRTNQGFNNAYSHISFLFEPPKFH